MTDVAKHDSSSNPKNKSKSEGGWCTEDLYFDQEGCICVANPALARAIEDSLNAWSGRMTMYRFKSAEEIEAAKARLTRPRARSAAPGMEIPGAYTDETRALAEGQRASVARMAYMATDPGTGEEEEEVGNPANMMCPCAPEP